MITDEQIKNLKPGDAVLVEAKVNIVAATGADVTHGCISHKLPFDKLYPVPEQPRHDPCRKFRKGDIVRLRKYNGRKPYDYWHKQTIKHFGAKLDTVLEDELDSGNVDIFQDAPIDELTVRVHSCHLELVTPVEELERYIVIHNKNEKYFEVCWKDDDEPDGKTGRIRCRVTYWYHQPPMTYTETEAKAAAKAECDRLNAEYRKGMEK